jgi:hypothetical protein
MKFFWASGGIDRLQSEGSHAMKSAMITAALLLGLVGGNNPGIAEAGMNHQPHNTQKFMGVDKERQRAAGESMQAAKDDKQVSADRSDRRRGPARQVKHKTGMP